MYISAHDEHYADISAHDELYADISAHDELYAYIIMNVLLEVLSDVEFAVFNRLAGRIILI